LSYNYINDDKIIELSEENILFETIFPDNVAGSELKEQQYL
jgi:hypothetical protein